MTNQRDTVLQLTLPDGVVGQAINRPLFSIGDTPVTTATLLVGAAILAVTWLVSLVLQRATVRALTLRSKADPATLTIASRLVGYTVLIIGLGIALQTVGINVGALFAAGAFFAVAIGFAMQNLAQNFISGVILMTERTIKPCSIDIAVVRGSTLAGWLQRRRESSAVTTQTMILDGPFAETKG